MYYIETDRLILRSLKYEDDFDMFEYAITDKVGPYAGWYPHKSIEETRQLILLMSLEKETWGIELKKEKKLIGTIGLHVEKENDPRIRKLGFALNPNYWNQGYMTEASKAILKYAFEIIKLEKIIVKHYEFNKRSQRVIEKLGFSYINKTKQKDYKDKIETMINYEMTRSCYYDKIKSKI